MRHTSAPRTKFGQSKPSAPDSLGPARRQPLRSRESTAARLDQFYTRPEIAAFCLEILDEHIDPAAHLMVEPSVGDGSFFARLQPGSLGIDIASKHPGVLTADFLKVELPSDRSVCVVGNPPFGKNAALAVRFFNHAARWAGVIAFIVPRSFRKASVENRLDSMFRLLREEALPAKSFIFEGKARDVPAVFQIWVRQREPRPLRVVERSHPDFEFTTPEKADFAIQRIGARAGRVHRDTSASKSSHYFIKGDVESVMMQLDLAGAAANVAGNPSLAKSEIIFLYREWTGRRPRPSADPGAAQPAGRSSARPRAHPERRMWIPVGNGAVPFRFARRSSRPNPPAKRISSSAVPKRHAFRETSPDPPASKTRASNRLIEVFNVRPRSARYAQKRPTLQASNIRINQTIGENATWTAAKANARSKMLIDRH
jgi:hypothetical protein